MKPKENIMPLQSILEAVADGDYRESYFGGGRGNILETFSGQIKKKRNWVHMKWRELDNKYLKPCLITKESFEKQQRIKELISSSGNLAGKEVELEESREL